MSAKSGARKKWTKSTNKEKREWSTIITAQQAEDIKRQVPRSALISTGKLAERYKISLTVARKALEQLVQDGVLVRAISSHSLHCYQKSPTYVVEAVEVKAEDTKAAPKKGGKKGKKQ